MSSLTIKSLVTLGGSALLLFVLSGWGAGRPQFQLRRVAVDRAGGGDATLSPDGRRFVITSKRSGNWDVWMYELSTGKWTQLTDHPGDDIEGKLSPGGDRLVFCSTREGQKDIYVLDMRSRAVTRLTTSPDDDEYPAWSPDGKQIVYTGGPWGRRDFYVIPAGGGTPRRVSRQSGRAGACSFEPGGKTLICHRYDLGSGDVFRMWVDDGEISPLTIGTPWDYKPNTSPDGKQIAFSRAEEGPSHISLLPAAGGKVRQLTDSPYDDRWPTWSDAGDKLLFHRVVERGTAVKVLERKTGRARTLVGEDERPLQASFDPKATRVVYCSQTTGGKVLKILDVASGTSRLLDTGPGEACFPRWSPDGGRIAYVARSGARWEVSVVNPDGSGRVALTAGVAGLHGMDGPLDWSPDGTKLLFQSDTDPFEARIYTVDVATRAVRGVTDGAWFDEAPSWTPDGKGFVFMSTRGGNWTWGFFRRALSGGTYETLAGPDWEQKNFPRVGRGGSMLWSVHDEQDREFIGERTPDGKVRLLEVAGAGARWPTYSADESLVLYTVLERQVEYWIVENVTGVGSPALEPPATAAESHDDQPSDARSCRADDGPVNLWRSPVDLHHR